MLIHGPIAILRSSNPVEDPEGIYNDLSSNGIRLIEITLTTPGALAVVSRLSGNGYVVGVGSIRSRDDAQRARAAGASFLVTPGLVEGAAEAGIPVLMGAYTASEAMRAVELGAAAVKLFPAMLLTPAYAKALLAPLPDLQLVPTGGIGAKDFAAWRAAGCVGVGIGSELRIEERAGLAERARAIATAWSA
jgi:2-dehydro-3-deoxyphosphogluconate aldolase / (4S)-4-hydroxy-2-oxoglutarate aldolase